MNDKSMKVVLASTHVDSHRDRIPRKVLENSLLNVTGERRIRWLMNHRRDIPPMGYISDITLKDDADHTYMLGVTYPYEQRTEIEWDDSLYMEQAVVKYPFIGQEGNETNEFGISLDKNNLTSMDELSAIDAQISEILRQEVRLRLHSRKALENIPELIITIAKCHIAYKLIKPFATKFLEKVGEESAVVATAKARNGLKELGISISKIFNIVWPKTTPKNKGLAFCIEFPGENGKYPHVYLLIKTETSDLITKGFTVKNIESVRNEIERMMKFFDVWEITFELNSNGHYAFRFLITSDGSTVGKKIAFKERDRMYKRIISREEGFGSSSGAAVSLVEDRSED